MSSGPSVAVFMPTWNTAPYLVEAINSFRGQSFQNFRLFIFDGGSTDGTVEIARTLSQHDERITIRIIDQSTPNQRANLFLKEYETDIWINAHADDISFPERIAKQFTAMQTNPKTSVLGTALQFWLHDPVRCNEKFYTGLHTYPQTHDDIIARLPFWWCFGTPTVALNAKLFRERGLLLDEELRVGGDWDLYWKAGRIGELRNLDEALVSVRHHHESDGAKSTAAIANETRIVRERIAESIGLKTALSDESFSKFLNLSIEYDAISSAFFNEETLTLLDELCRVKTLHISPAQQSALSRYLQHLHQQIKTQHVPPNPLVHAWEKMIIERDKIIADLNYKGLEYVKLMEKEIADRDHLIRQLSSRKGKFTRFMHRLRHIVR